MKLKISHINLWEQVDCDSGGTELLLRCFLCKSSLAQQFYYLPYLSHLSARSYAAQRTAIYWMKQLIYRACNLCPLKHKATKTRLVSFLVTESQQNYLSVEFSSFAVPCNILLLFITFSGFKMMLASSELLNQKCFIQPWSSK